MDEKGKQWFEETQKRWLVVQSYFKPKEILVIADFMETMKEVKEDEIKG